MTTEERRAWLEERQTGIGSSDAADVVCRGWSGANGPQRVYQSKTDPVNAALPHGGLLRRGIDLEELVAEKYCEAMEVPLATEKLVRHPERTWMLASNDRVRPDGRRVELKTTAGFGDGWGECGSGDVPDAYWIQLQHQMAVVGADSIDLFALDVIGWHWRMFRVDEDAKFRDWLVETEREFWERFVLQRTSPGPEWNEKVEAQGDTLLVNPDEIDLGGKWEAILDARKQQMAARASAESLVADYNEQLRQALGGARRAKAGRYRVKLIEVAGGDVSYHREPYTRLQVSDR